MIREILCVGAGGFVGSVLRYLVAVAMGQVGTGFPWPTFVVNIVGCLLIGMIGGVLSRHPAMSTGVALFLTVGVCGGFTTFSTFGKETLLLLQSANYIMALAYVLGSIVVGVAAVWLGHRLTNI